MLPGLRNPLVPAVLNTNQSRYEMMWDTKEFNDPKYFSGGKQPLVYSFGDG